MRTQNAIGRLPLEPLRYGMLVFAAACQFATVLITWPLWLPREDPPHLPTVDLPQIGFAWPILVSLAIVLIRPREGVTLHAILLAAAAFLDQFRLQPQFFAIALLMAACVWPWASLMTRWFFASTWVWAGLHKLLSPDWLGHSSFWLIERSGVEDPHSIHLAIAIGVALTELALGLLACFKPRWAAPACVALHLGIIVTLSPLVLNWNFSVIPWNLCMAVIGCWILWKTPDWKPEPNWEKVAAFAWMIAPVGFYFGLIDHGFSGVLYSEWIPQGQITSRDGPRRIVGWGDLSVPFPNERRTLRMYFEQIAQPGDKLHIADPRRFLEDQFFVLKEDGSAVAIDRDSFFLDQPMIENSPSVMGVAVDEQRSIFALRNAGVKMVQRSAAEPIYAVAFTSQNYSPKLLRLLSGLPNLQQIQLAETSVGDDDLKMLSDLRMLTGIGLDHTAVTDKGLEHLRGLPYLQYIECEGTAISDETVASFRQP